MGSPDIAHDFNESSMGHHVKHGVTHVLWMGAMMGVIGLAAPAFAMPIDPYSLSSIASTGATAGDFLVQTAHGSWEMLSMVVDALGSLLSIGGDLVTNTLAGNFMPTTWDNLIMSHGGEHIAGAASHAAVEHSSGAAFEEWLRNAFESDTLDIAMEDSEMAGLSLEDYYLQEYGHEGH